MRKPTSASTMVTADEAPNCLIRFSHHLPKLQIRAYSGLLLHLLPCATLHMLDTGMHTSRAIR